MRVFKCNQYYIWVFWCSSIHVYLMFFPAIVLYFKGCYLSVCVCVGLTDFSDVKWIHLCLWKYTHFMVKISVCIYTFVGNIEIRFSLFYLFFKVIFSMCARISHFGCLIFFFYPFNIRIGCEWTYARITLSQIWIELNEVQWIEIIGRLVCIDL